MIANLRDQRAELAEWYLLEFNLVDNADICDESSRWGNTRGCPFEACPGASASETAWQPYIVDERSVRLQRDDIARSEKRRSSTLWAERPRISPTATLPAGSFNF